MVLYSKLSKIYKKIKYGRGNIQEEILKNFSYFDTFYTGLYHKFAANS